MVSSDPKDTSATGVVTETLPNAMFRVALPDEKQVIAYLSGKMRIHKIKVLIGDRVELTLDQYGGRGRIIKRL